jgi:hypothetical protein
MLPREGVSQMLHACNRIASLPQAKFDFKIDSRPHQYARVRRIEHEINFLVVRSADILHGERAARKSEIRENWSRSNLHDGTRVVPLKDIDIA